MVLGYVNQQSDFGFVKIWVAFYFERRCMITMIRYRYPRKQWQPLPKPKPSLSIGSIDGLIGAQS